MVDLEREIESIEAELRLLRKTLSGGPLAGNRARLARNVAEKGMTIAILAARLEGK